AGGLGAHSTIEAVGTQESMMQAIRATRAGGHVGYVGVAHDVQLSGMDLFFSGVRPAVNVGLSVSRVGGSAQVKAMKQVAGKLRLDLAQYNELAAFAQFGSDLDKASQAQLARGQRIVEILKQDQYQPQSVPRQVALIFAATNGFLDDLPVEALRRFEADLLNWLEKDRGDLLKTLADKKTLDDDLKAKLSAAVGEFKARFKV
ncbi:MAG TPA: hypothetical protein PKX64_03090, partial [Elusimicrobiota bacterium]|nr:hypothetical protein [Elusimicrobiota bacterium]